MYEILDYEYELFLKDMESGETFCQYVDESAYEDDYSHNTIEKAQDNFIKKATKWLRENKPNQYVITDGWCVFVMTIEEAEKRNLLDINDDIVK